MSERMELDIMASDIGGGTPNVIDLKNITKEFQVRGGASATVLKDVSLTVADGGIYCLVGPSGSGKSTLLNILAGFEKQSSGVALVDNVPVDGPGSDRIVVFQNAFLYPWLRVRDLVSLGPRLRGEPKSTWGDRCSEFINAVGLSGYEDYYPYELSGGMKQRVALARALINEPKVLLLDEPFGALDAQTRIQMQKLLLDVWVQFRTTIFFITHDVEEALFLGDHVGVLSKQPGRIIDEVTLDLPQPRNFDVTTTAAFGLARQKILRYLV